MEWISCFPEITETSSEHCILDDMLSVNRFFFMCSLFCNFLMFGLFKKI